MQQKQTSHSTQRASRHWFFTLLSYRSVWVTVALLFLLVPAVAIVVEWQQRRQEQQANEHIWKAERYVEERKYKHALEGDGTYKGFYAIIKEYPTTKAAQRAHYHIATIEMERAHKKGQAPEQQARHYQKAIDHLNCYTTKDPVLYPTALAMQGDAYAGLGQHAQALQWYEQAINYSPNPSYTPDYLLSAAYVCIEQGDLVRALPYLQQICDRFPQSRQDNKAQKLIGFCETRLRQNQQTTTTSPHAPTSNQT